MTDLSFKDYLESKQRLKDSLKKNPVFENTYTVYKYCKIPVFEDKTKDNMLLKPESKIIIEWSYENEIEPRPISLRFVNIKNINEHSKYTITWTGEKLKKWLSKNVELDYIF